MNIWTSPGEPEAAVEQLDYLLSIPAGLSVQMLRIGPKWDQLRDNPEFQRLLEKYSSPEFFRMIASNVPCRPAEQRRRLGGTS